jgi:2-deoxy-D-gluconate 3-dehydrogenase
MMTDISEVFDLTGRVVVVTGGAGLLGAGFCRTLAEASAHVIIADSNEAAAVALADSLIQRGFQAQGVAMDITSARSVKQMVDTSLKTFGHLDILVNSAALDPKFDPKHLPDNGEHYIPEKLLDVQTAIPVAGTFEDYPLDAWKQALDVNLTGAFLCCQAAARTMLAQGGGVIANIASIYGLVGPDQRIYEYTARDVPGGRLYKPVYYSVTKAGILGLTRYLATYYAGQNIRVNALTPGGVFNGHDPAFVQAYSARTVLGRMADKDEMNGALLFLVSDASAYMTGANLVVDGGWTAW